MKNFSEEYRLAVEKTIQAHHRMGFPVYQCKEGYLIAIYPDGREIKLEKASIGLNGA